VEALGLLDYLAGLGFAGLVRLIFDQGFQFDDVEELPGFFLHFAIGDFL